jgi:hypothetical protein
MQNSTESSNNRVIPKPDVAEGDASASESMKLLEISIGASISALIPLKILMNHLIKSGVVEKDDLLRDMETNLDLSLYKGEIRAMLEPIWASLKKELGHG